MPSPSSEPSMDVGRDGASSGTNLPPPATNAWARPLRAGVAGAGSGLAVAAKGGAPPGLSLPNRSTTSLNSNGGNKKQQHQNQRQRQQQQPPQSSNSDNAIPVTGDALELNLRQRFLHLSLSVVGHSVTLKLVDGTSLEGILHSFTPFHGNDSGEGKGEELTGGVVNGNDDGWTKKKGKKDTSSKNGKSNKNSNTSIETSGVKSTIPQGCHYVVKACRAIPNNATTPGFVEGSTVVVPSSRVTSATFGAVRLDNGRRSEPSAGAAAASAGAGALATDGDISNSGPSSGSGGGRARSGRALGVLVAAGDAWTSIGGGGGALSASATAASPSPTDGSISALSSSLPPSNPSRFGSLGEGGGGKGSTRGLDGSLKGAIGNWDQFAANRDLTGEPVSQYDENLYTTELPKRGNGEVGISSREYRDAERIAREIQGQTTDNIHLMEERGQMSESDFHGDEEDRYSGVLRTANNDRARGGKGLSSGGKKERAKLNLTPRSGGVATDGTGNAPVLTVAPSTSISLSQPYTGVKKSTGGATMNYAAAAGARNKGGNRNDFEAVADEGMSTDATVMKMTKKIVDIEKEDKSHNANKKKKEKSKLKKKKEGVASSLQSSSSSGGGDPTNDNGSETKKTEPLKKKKEGKDRKTTVTNDELESLASKDLSKDQTSKNDEIATVEINNDDKVFSESINSTTTVETKKSNLKMSKLNANAKSFSFNPSAKPFAPTSSTVPPTSVPDMVPSTMGMMDHVSASSLHAGTAMHPHLGVGGQLQQQQQHGYLPATHHHLHHLQHHQIHHHHHPQVVHHQTTPHGTVVPGGHYGGNPGMMQLAGPPHVPTVTTTGTNPAHHTNGPSTTTRNAMPTVPVSASDRTAEGTLPSSTMEKPRVDGGESARGSTPGTSSASSSNEPTQTPPPHVQSAMPVAYANAGYYPVPGVGGRGMHAAPLHGQHPGQYVPPPQMVHGQPIPVSSYSSWLLSVQILKLLFIISLMVIILVVSVS